MFWIHAHVVDQTKLTLLNPILKSEKHDLWHRRLAHPSDEVLRHFARSTKNFPKFQIPKEHKTVCKGCAKGKMTDKPHSENPKRMEKPFERVHCDLKEFAVQSYYKCKYFICFLDDATSHGWLYFLTKKSQAAEAINTFEAMAKTQYNATVKEFFLDNGGEFISTDFLNGLKSKGTKACFTAPYAHQSNGRAERFNRTIMEKFESMRHYACLPDSWWQFTCTYAIYLYNRTPVRRLDWITPCEQLKGEQPDLTHIKIMGCAAYVFLHKEQRKNKLSPRSELMTFIGFDPNTDKVMMFMRSPNNVIFRAQKALFDEELFPRCQKKNQIPQSSRYSPPKEYPTFDIGRGRDQSNEDFPYPPFPKEMSDKRSPVPAQSLPSPMPGPSSPRTPRRQDSTDDETRGGYQTPPEQMQPPVAHPPPAPRKLGRTRKPAEKPGNIYKPGTIADKDHRRALPVNSHGVASISERADPSNSCSNQLIESVLFSETERGVAQNLLATLLSKRVDEVIFATDHGLTKDVRDWTPRDLLQLPANQQSEWKQAIKDELEVLVKRKVYELADLPPGRKAIKNRWVFDIKTDGRKKARLVAKGFSQIEGIDYDELFSPVVRFESVRTIFALAALEQWKVWSLDVKSAFLYGDLDEEIYMEQPAGFSIKGQEKKVLRLRRAIYGLKQATRAWWTRLNKSLEVLGFTKLYSDAGIFVSRHNDGTMVIMLAYVDDIQITGPNTKLVHEKRKLFMDKWECLDLGESREFLRMNIQYEAGRILLDQTAYLEKVLKCFGMSDAKAAKTPLPTGYCLLPFEGTSNAQLRSLYQSVIGSLLYLMLGTRPDIVTIRPLCPILFHFPDTCFIV